MSHPPVLASLPRLPTTRHPLSPAASLASTASAGSCTSGGPARPAYFSSRLCVRPCLSMRIRSCAAFLSMSCGCMCLSRRVQPTLHLILFFTPQVHMLHLVPQWQSAERHRKLKVMMQDRPDLIKSELAGLAFDSLQQVFRKVDIDAMFAAPPLELAKDQDVFLIIDPAAGGPSSDYAVVSLVRQRGIVTVRFSSRDQIPLPALARERAHVLRRAEEAGHELLPQVKVEARELGVVLVETHQLLLELAVDVQQQEEERNLLRVRRGRRVPPEHVQRVARRVRKVFVLQEAQAPVDALEHVRRVRAVCDLLDDVRLVSLTCLSCAGHRHRHAVGV
jgi:hypothetical protein